MKIAIPTKGDRVDSHFGHCEYYTIVSVSPDGQIEKMELYQAPQECGCKSDLAAILANMGVRTMLAGNMGPGAVDKITSAGIQVYRGCSGNIEELTKAFLREEVEDSGESCQHHEHGSDHEHHGNSCHNA